MTLRLWFNLAFSFLSLIPVQVLHSMFPVFPQCVGVSQNLEMSTWNLSIKDE